MKGSQIIQDIKDWNTCLFSINKVLIFHTNKANNWAEIQARGTAEYGILDRWYLRKQGLTKFTIVHPEIPKPLTKSVGLVKNIAPYRCHGVLTKKSSKENESSVTPQCSTLHLAFSNSFIKSFNGSVIT